MPPVNSSTKSTMMSTHAQTGIMASFPFFPAATSSRGETKYPAWQFPNHERTTFVSVSEMRLLVFLHGTELMHPGAVGSRT
jgi:hypothetical protein